MARRFIYEREVEFGARSDPEPDKKEDHDKFLGRMGFWFVAVIVGIYLYGGCRMLIDQEFYEKVRDTPSRIQYIQPDSQDEEGQRI